MPIDEYNRQLLPESKSTQMGNPAWMICKYAMLWPCCSLFSFKALLYFSRHLFYFSEIIFHSAFILFHSAFILFHIAFGKELLFNFSKCKQVLIFYSSKYGIVSNFLFQNMHQLLLNFL